MGMFVAYALVISCKSFRCLPGVRRVVAATVFSCSDKEIRRATLNSPMKNNQMALRDVALLLGVAPYRIQYAIVTGRVQEPRSRIANNRIYEVEDVRRLAVHFGRPIPEEMGVPT